MPLTRWARKHMEVMMAKKYDQDFKNSVTGKALYQKWVRMRYVGCCREWQDDFMKFVQWSFDSGFRDGTMLKRLNEKEEYSPENCYWTLRKAEPTETKKVCEHRGYTASAVQALWNKTVNRIREHYGMEPLEVNEPDFKDRTCKDCVHYKVCKYKRDDVPICEDYLD
jgi:hypothetical protein